MRYLILVAVTILLIEGCKKNENSGSDGSRIIIKGTISGINSKGGGAKSANSLSLSDAKKVLVFNSTSYKLFNIADNSFTVDALSGTATALAFLDSENKYIGCLCAGGLNVLPLVSLKDGDKTVIDLSTLTLSGTSVVPANNPIGNEINLNAGEIARYKELGVYYESLSKNIDADNDGVPDILVKKDFNISTIFDIYCGSWGMNDSPPKINNTSGFYVNYNMRIAGGKSLIPVNTNVTVTGPAASPYQDIRQTHYATGPDCFIAFFSRSAPAPMGYPFGTAFLPFDNGIYTLTLDSKTYTLNYSNISAKYFFIIAAPTIKTNDKNEIVSVSVGYSDMQNNSITPENFVYQTQVTLNGNQKQLCQMGSLWENPEAKTNTDIYKFVLPKPVPLSDVQNLNVTYLDLIGNAYNISFVRQ